MNSTHETIHNTLLSKGLIENKLLKAFYLPFISVFYFGTFIL